VRSRQAPLGAQWGYPAIFLADAASVAGALATLIGVSRLRSASDPIPTPDYPPTG
jgi:hypothetical protein